MGIDMVAEVDNRLARRDRRARAPGKESGSEK